MAHATFTWDSTELDARLAELPPKLEARIEEIVDLAAARGETEMKIKAPWVDRTGAARAGLFATPTHEGIPGGLMRHTIIFGHTVDYGIYLETISNGRWQVIMPVAKATGDALMLSLTDLLSELDEAPRFAIVAPELGRPGTSQGPERGAEYVVGRTFRRPIRRAISSAIRRLSFARFRRGR